MFLKIQRQFDSSHLNDSWIEMVSENAQMGARDRVGKNLFSQLTKETGPEALEESLLLV